MTGLIKEVLNELRGRRKHWVVVSKTTRPDFKTFIIHELMNTNKKLTAVMFVALFILPLSLFYFLPVMFVVLF